MRISLKKTIVLFAFFGFALALPLSVKAVYIGQSQDFFVDPTYDISERETISAILLKIGPETYYYAEEDWWNSFSQIEQNDAFRMIEALDGEFHQSIYPTLTSTLGSN